MTKIGFACMILDENGQLLDGTQMRTTTVKHFSTLSDKEKQIKIENLTENNLQALDNQIQWLSQQLEQLRFMRITSDLFPLYTHPLARSFYPPLMKSFEYKLGKIGKTIREKGLRVTSHPGQFTVLNNPDQQITQRSVLDLEYHADIFRMMGLDSTLGTVINIHGGGRANGLDQLIVNSRLVSDFCRSLISVENDESSFDIDDLLNSRLPEHFPIVVDVHHTWISTGRYIFADDPRWTAVKQSWQGRVPKIHASMSPKNLVENLSVDSHGLPQAPETGRNKLRQHSEMLWSPEFRTYTASFLQHGDLMIEAKNKNLAAVEVYTQMVHENEQK